VAVKFFFATRIDIHVLQRLNQDILKAKAFSAMRAGSDIDLVARLLML